MEKKTMLAALKQLDALLTEPLELLVGGGALMLIVYDFPLSTADIDAVPMKSNMTITQLAPLVHQVSTDLNIPRDWLNDYFSTFLFALPPDYAKRLQTVFKGQLLHAHGLGKEDLLILKCMAGRPKDRSHAKALLKKGVDLGLVESHLHHLSERGIPKTQAAIDFFDELVDEIDA